MKKLVLSVLVLLSALTASPVLVSPTSTVTLHSGYSLEYAEPYEQARWVAYTLTAADASLSGDRSDDFRPDPAIITGSATPGDYKGSGYDKGHLKPAADSRASAESMSDCFYMSNMSPQVPSFNRGVWKRLEDQVRDWAREYGAIEIVTGPVLQEGLPTIGVSHVAVPKAFYKVILVANQSDTSAIGFILKNEGSSAGLWTFVVTVDSVEKAAGIDAFSELPDSIENRIEAHVEPSHWSFDGDEVGVHPALYKGLPKEVRGDIPVEGGAVIFNTRSLKFHCPDCASAKQCTANCIELDRGEAIEKGGVPCGRCGGRCR